MHTIMIVHSQVNIIVCLKVYMLCKKHNFSNNPVYMDTSEIRLLMGLVIL